MPAYYVTATGTDIGKTYIAASLLKAWRGRGYGVAATKPVMTGFDEDDLVRSDCGRLLEAMGQACVPAAVSEMCLHRLAPPLAPNVAMRKAGMKQDYGGIRDFVFRRLKMPADRHLVEGAGGVMSPLTDTSLQLDLMTDLELPVILVTAAYLGSVSHTLSAIDALRSRGLYIMSVIVSEPVQGQGDLVTFCEEISRFRNVPIDIVAYGNGKPPLSLLSEG